MDGNVYQNEYTSKVRIYITLFVGKELKMSRETWLYHFSLIRSKFELKWSFSKFNFRKYLDGSCYYLNSASANTLVPFIAKTLHQPRLKFLVYCLNSVSAIFLLSKLCISQCLDYIKHQNHINILCGGDLFRFQEVNKSLFSGMTKSSQVS